MRILVFAAHPDDDILGCGGMIAKRVEGGNTVRVEFIAEGTSCRFNDPNDPLVENQVNERILSGKNSLKSLGVQNYNFNNLPCGRLDQVPQIEINKIMEAAIFDFEPDVIFTHSDKDTNTDHRIVNSCTLVATRSSACRLPAVPSRPCFPSRHSGLRRSSRRWGYRCPRPIPPAGNVGASRDHSARL